MLAVILLGFTAAWAFWFTYMVRYPSQWAARVARHRRLLLSFGIDLPWMHRIEKGRANRRPMVGSESAEATGLFR